MTCDNLSGGITSTPYLHLRSQYCVDIGVTGAGERRCGSCPPPPRRTRLGCGDFIQLESS